MKEYFVIRKLVNENKFEEAIKKAESVKDKQEKAMMLCMIAEAMIYEGRKKNAILLLNDALETAKEIDEELFQLLAIGKVSFTMAIAGEVKKAVEIARSITDNSEKVYAMTRISDMLITKNKIEEAKEVLKEAEKAVDEIRNDLIGKFLSIKTLVHAFVLIGDSNKASDLLKHAENVAENMNEENAAIAFYLIGQIMIELGRVDDSMKLIEKIENGYDKLWLMSDIAYERADADLLEEVAKVGRGVMHNYEAVSGFSKITSIMSKFGKEQEASKLINEMVKISEGIEEGMEKTMSLALISNAMFENGDERYADMLNKAVEISKKLEDFEREEACSLIARTMIEIGKSEDALNFIDGIEDEDVKGAVYISLANDLIYDGMKEEAMKIAEFMDDKILKERIRRGKF
ncbi:MAG: hypothetical protein J7J34_06450 [Thermoplasmata archaeon]|nr:hypothetical protein [Thermoplasmata archaeon]